MQYFICNSVNYLGHSKNVNWWWWRWYIYSKIQRLVKKQETDNVSSDILQTV